MLQPSRFLWLIAFSIATSHLIARGDESSELLFVRRIMPLLESKCVSCHGQDTKSIRGELDLTSRAGALRGGESEQPSIRAGQPDKSPLYLAATRQHDEWSAMPPKEADRLTDEQLGWLRQWIKSGAAWPDAERARTLAKEHESRWATEDGSAVVTSGGQSAAWTNRKYKLDDLWGYRPVVKPSVPSGSPHPVDAFLSARLPEGLIPATATDPRTFIRRATLDLTGLLPAPEQVQQFVDDCGPGSLDSPTADAAIAALIDRLLASPHYGERMAQHWLDVTRYADSSGFSNDYERGNAWRYRDYVVRAFNRDKPYDQFIREQIAGDELSPDDPEMLIAVGFLRMGPWELTGMEVAKIARQRFLDDVTNSVGESFLAQSLQCARCHDHKFDPVPTRDYYSLQAVFATTQLAERPAAFLPEENLSGFDERRFLEARQEELLQWMKSLDDKSLAAVPQWYADHKLDGQPWTEALAQVKNARRGRFNATRNQLLKQGVPEDQFPPRMLGLTPEEIGLERIANKGLERLKWELERYEPVAFSVYDGRTPQVTSVNEPIRIPASRLTAGEWEQTTILTGGDPFATGERVAPGVLSVLPTPLLMPLPDTMSGRRLALAHWIARADNPLTTRAIANRVWMWHWGRPLAGNPNNFGSTGKRPTHPELLDWLSATFVENNWSFKALHRLLMTSQAYRRGTEHQDVRRLKELDPNGTSYAVFQPRRLSAEELRDAMLATSGELNRTLGGIPNRPEIHLEVALQPRQVMGTFAAAWTPNPLPSQRHRRSLYSWKLRGLADPFLEVFNSPAPDFSCERREASTIAPQAFSLFNGQSVHSRALALAHRVIQETKTNDDALTRLFQLVYSRTPTAAERQRCLAHWNEMLAFAETVATPARLPREVVRDAIEENTGERFSYRERLFANEHFVADLQPAEVDARTRALADVCLVLLNTNEFVYVY